VESRAKSPGEITRLLSATLSQGPFVIGQIRVVAHGSGAFLLHHVAEEHLAETQLTCDPNEAVRLALYDPTGKYRPLKTAPSLAQGWRMELASLDELRLALDLFYPSALGMWVDFMAEGVRPTPWRETVDRQTGMYRIVGKITDEQTCELLGRTCQRDSGCLRHILWPLRPGQSHPLQETNRAALLARFEAGEIPLLCVEACNLVVAAGRPVVKEGRYPGDPPAPAIPPAE
jgi:sirohydrochlorin cobaltochelatase